jgi:hypothetical protein
MTQSSGLHPSFREREISFFTNTKRAIPDPVSLINLPQKYYTELNIVILYE